MAGELIRQKKAFANFLSLEMRFIICPFVLLTFTGSVCGDIKQLTIGCKELGSWEVHCGLEMTMGFVKIFHYPFKGHFKSGIQIQIVI
jgi:hypothetical protein